MAEIQDIELFKLMIAKHGAKNTAMYYLRKAHKAVGRAKTALANKNAEGALMEAQTVFDNVETLFKFLADDDRGLALNKEAKPKTGSKTSNKE